MGGLGTAAAIGANPLFERFLRFRAAAALWLAASAAADLLIAVVFTLHVVSALCHFLARSRADMRAARESTGTSLPALAGSRTTSRAVRIALRAHRAHSDDPVQQLSRPGSSSASAPCCSSSSTSRMYACHLLHSTAGITLTPCARQPQGNRLTLALPLSKLHANTLLCALNARAGWGWGAAFDAGSPGVPAAGGTRKSGGTAPGSPLRARARSGSGRSRRGLGLGFGPMGGATSKVSVARKNGMGERRG